MFCLFCPAGVSGVVGRDERAGAIPRAAAAGAAAAPRARRRPVPALAHALRRARAGGGLHADMRRVCTGELFTTGSIEKVTRF